MTTAMTNLMLFVVAITIGGAMLAYYVRKTTLVNHAFKFKVKQSRVAVIFQAVNTANPALSFEAHFYSKNKDSVGDRRPRAAMQQYFGKRVYTFVVSNTDRARLNIDEIGAQLINLALADRLCKHQERVDFELGLIRDMLFGFDYEGLEKAKDTYSPEMFDSMTTTSREFNTEINSLSFNHTPAKEVKFKWVTA